MQEAYEAGMKTYILSFAIVHLLLSAMCGISEIDRVSADLIVQTVLDSLYIQDLGQALFRNLRIY